MRLPRAAERAWLAQLDDGMRRLGLPAPPEFGARLLDYVDLLKRWNRAYNLTAIDEPDLVLSRHLLDSLSVAPYLSGQRILDVGSGAGLPGIPLAMYFPGREFHLLDSNGKKTRFLFQASSTLALGNVSVHHSRAEALQDTRGFDCVLARAVAPLEGLVRICGHLLAPGGALLAMKAELTPEELQGVVAPYNVVACIELAVPGLPQRRQLVRIERIAKSSQPNGSAA